MLYATGIIKMSKQHMIMLYLMEKSRPLLKKKSIDINIINVYSHAFKLAINAYYAYFIVDADKGKAMSIKKLAFDVMCHVAHKMQQKGCEVCAIDIDSIYFIGKYDVSHDEYKPFSFYMLNKP